MNHGSLFSGIGGFDLASEWMGWDNKFHCEWEDFPRRVLEYHFPNAISYGDIKQTDFTIWRGRIDILTGGFPCQPYSAAGKRLGKQDERHLWPEMLRTIREIKPRWIVGENVRGLLNWNGGVVLDEIYTDLEDEGYEVWTFVLPAASVNAPHRRDRVWIVAYSDCRIEDKNSRANPETKGEVWGHEEGNVLRELPSARDVANTNSLRRRGGIVSSKSDKEQRDKMGSNINQHRDGVRGEAEGRSPTTSNSSSIRHTLSGQSKSSKEEGRSLGQGFEDNWDGVWGEDDRRSTIATNANGTRLEGQTTQRVHSGQGRKSEVQDDERSWRGSETYEYRWETFPTKSPVCGEYDGIPRKLDSITFPKWRKESIKAYGNAIVPQVAHQIFKAIERYEQSQG